MNLDLLDQGFIPEEICLKLPDNFSDIEKLASELPKVLANEQIEKMVSQLEIEKNIDTLTTPQLERAMLVFSICSLASTLGNSEARFSISEKVSGSFKQISSGINP